jgi:TRAP-type C4-dicarboxylate transport system substrate-binding protein
MIRASMLVLLALTVPRSTASAQTVLRLATAVPDGTAWAHELRAGARDTERRTNGRVRVKWYWGGIAGGEQEMAERMRRGQLDGAASGGPLCSEIMPSMAVLQIPGLLQSAAEGTYLFSQLSARLSAEAEQAGFTYLASGPLGSAVFFGRRPVQSLAELRKARVWVWDAVPIAISLLREMGLAVAPAPLERAAREFDAGRLDGFWALPTAALAFQWSVQAPFLVTLPGEYLFDCVVVTSRAFQRLSVDDQHQLRAAVAESAERLYETSRQQERALLSGAFQHQGLTIIEPSEKFRAEFFAAANAARDRLGPRLVAPELLQRVRAMLSDYRAEYQARTR